MSISPFSFALPFDYANRQTVGDNAAIAGLPVAITYQIPDAATADIDIVIADKMEVLDVICQKKNGAGAANTMQIKTGAGVAISDAIACAVDKAITRAGSIDTAQSVILAGGILRCTATRAAGTRNALVTVIGILRA